MFHDLAAMLVAESLSEFGLREGSSAVDLGNQTFSVSSGCIDRLAMTGNETKVKGGLLSLKGAGDRSATVTAMRMRGDLEDVKKFIEQEKGDSDTAKFFLALGFSSYESIDLNGRFGAHRMDLNKILSEEYGFDRKYDLVINSGTSEHLFGQGAFMRNMHDLTSGGGLMMHILPSVGYVNHGFYNYQPGFFWDLAAANGYEMLSMRLVDRDGVLLDIMEPNETNALFAHYFHLLPESPSGNVMLAVVMRKTGDGGFKVPVQNKYLDDIDGEDIKRTYGGQVAHVRPTKKGLFAPESLPSWSSRAFRTKRKLKAGMLLLLRRISRAVLKL